MYLKNRKVKMGIHEKRRLGKQRRVFLLAQLAVFLLNEEGRHDKKKI